MPNQPTILYIEDNADNQRLVSRVLEARGFRILIADDGPRGIDLAEQSMPELVLVDMNIPSLDGYETATRLRSMPHLRTTPIVALTADVQPGTRERTLAAGCDGYISKPIDPRQLPQQVQEFIDGKREALPEPQETAVLREYTRKLVYRLEAQVEEVRSANQQLQEVDKLKSQFIAMVSHELRTPLTSILGYVELFERGTLGELGTAQQEAMEVLGRNARQLADQLNSLIYLQEVRASQLKRAPFLVHEVLRRVLGDLQHRADEAGVIIRAQLQPTALYNGDALSIEHALRQIVDNAIKFTPAGGQVLAAVQDDPRGVLVRVRDTGIGIPPEIGDKIFQPFYQVDSSLARTRSGVGVGLALVKHIIEAHSGEVSVRSEPGKGTLVSVVLGKA
ncbi:MAG: hybrid sensor histidine kinase/response regulator [Roseiflexaceae bacterium]|nr:hybrid sensor histidine kinase/response regulator [Roseiflexaceae bacterium]